MKGSTLFVISILLIAYGCDNTPYSREAATPELENGVLARTTQETALWSKKELKVLEGPNWANAKASRKLVKGAVIFCASIDSSYTQVKALNSEVGFIATELLEAIYTSKRDSIKYTSEKRAGKIITYVDGMDVGTVKLWSSATSRDKMVDQLVKGEKVVILEEQEPYVKLGTINGIEGWCMKGFVKE
jgi:hypothetical protein